MAKKDELTWLPPEIEVVRSAAHGVRVHGNARRLTRLDGGKYFAGLLLQVVVYVVVNATLVLQCQKLKINIISEILLANSVSKKIANIKRVKTQVISIGTQPAIQRSKPIRNTQLEWDFLQRMRGFLHTLNRGRICAEENLTPAPGISL